MLIKLDENMPERLALLLREHGHDVETVHDEGLTGSDDPTVWGAAQAEQRFFITQDLDFSDVRAFAPGTHAGLLLVRLHIPSRSALAGRIATIINSEAVENWKRCFVVATDRKLRVLRPPDEEQEPAE
jgi:predicted nuclease of predicted toxin-antitoxin system